MWNPNRKPVSHVVPAYNHAAQIAFVDATVEQALSHTASSAPGPATATVAQPAKESHMAFSFKSIGHFFSAALHDVFVGAKAVESAIAKVNTPANQKLVEDFTALIPSVGPAAVDLERGVFAIAGEVAGVLNDATKGGETALVNAGFDATIIAEFKALIASIPGTIKNPPTVADVKSVS